MIIIPSQNVASPYVSEQDNYQQRDTTHTNESEFLRKLDHHMRLASNNTTTLITIGQVSR